MEPTSQLATPPQAPADNTPPADNQQPTEPQVIDQSLNTEITPEQEQQLINETLGLEPQESGEKQDGLQFKEGTQPSAENGQQPTQSGEQQPNQPAESKSETTTESTDELKAPDTTIQTDDLWIEVDKVVQNEDGTTKTEKVKLVYDPDNPSTFVPDDFQFVSDKQLFEIMEAKSEMANLYKERKSEVEKAIAEFESKKSEATTQQEQLAAWDAEIDMLIDAGIMEAPKAKAGTPEFTKDPTVQKIDNVFKFMKERNKELVKNGKNPIKSFTLAYNMHEAEAKKQADEAAKKQEIERKQTLGSMVGGSSAPSAGGSNKGHYVSGTYSNVQNAQLDDEGNLI